MSRPGTPAAVSTSPQRYWNPGGEVLKVYDGCAHEGGTVHLQSGGHTVAKG
jgi:hypothetical protein